MRIGVIGCGAIGSRYAHWLSQLGQDVGVMDVDADRLRPVADSGARCFETLQGVLEWQPERVIVATPPHHHETAAMPFLEQGIHMLIEKPVAHTIESAQRLAEAAERTGASAQVVCNMRFHVGVQGIREHLHRVGRPLYCRGMFGHRLSQMRKVGGEFARQAEFGGGVVMDCIHEFDFLQWIFGPIHNLASHVDSIGEDTINAEDIADIRLEFESGIQGALHLDFLMRQKRRGLEIIGTEGNLSWLSTGKAPEQCTVEFDTNDIHELLVEDLDVDSNAEYLAMLSRFLEGDVSELQTINESIRSLELALRARAGT
ncbi:MAG: Gfo/Idh/MocA family oxidoreductase [Phycisphaerales bacterium]|nr:Gfo/Idh/MocA family oxidoreductase [Phycisphaerales bacterium]